METIASGAAAAALSRAERLAAAGDPVEAIGLLTAANRAGRDPGIERRLVELRHEAFSPVPPVDRPPVVGAEPPGPGPVRALPEVRPSDLDVGVLRRGLARHGCLLVRGLVAPGRAAELAAGIDTALEAFDRTADVPSAGGEPDTDGWYVPFRPRPGAYRVGGRRDWVRASGALWTADSPRMLFELTELVEATGIGDLVREHLGERPALSANKCTLRRVPVTTNAGWHQDGAFLGRDVGTLNLWLSLSHCGEDAPGLDIVPRRFDDVVETGTGGAFFDWAVGDEVAQREAGDTGILRPAFAPGDALLFDHLLLHRTAVSPEMTRERHAIETWFFAPSTYPEGQIPLVL